MEHWGWKVVFNGLGAITTAITLVIVTVSKFAHGAWIVAVLIIGLVAMFRTIEHHYQLVGPQLSLRGMIPSDEPVLSPRVVIPISGVHKAAVKALQFALSISPHVTAVYVEVDPALTDHVREEWAKWGQGVPLEVLPSPYRSVVGVLMEYLERTDLEHHDGQAAVLVLPEFIPAVWWQNLLHNQTAWLIKLGILYQRRRLGSGRIVVDVPFHLRF